MIPIYQPRSSNKMKEYVNNCLKTNWISSKGYYVNKFEKKFCNYIKNKGKNCYSTSVCNGTVALHLALSSLNIGKNDEVIVPTLTYIATINTILQVGASPVYVDSCKETWLMDNSKIINKITHRTRAIMIVHLYGLACNMDEIKKICKKYKLFLIEDCAEAFGTYYKKQHVGTFGDFSTFSFFGNKTITTGEGGMVVSNSKKLIEIASHLKNQGVSKIKEYWHDTVAYNYRMTNICAAIGLAQLEDADNILKSKKNLYKLYKKGFASLPLILHEETINTIHSFWMCSIMVKDFKKRDMLRNFLKSRFVETRPCFIPAHKMPHSFSKDIFPIAERISLSVINLPSWPDIKKNEVYYIVDQVKNFYNLL